MAGELSLLLQYPGGVRWIDRETYRGVSGLSPAELDLVPKLSGPMLLVANLSSERYEIVDH